MLSRMRAGFALVLPALKRLVYDLRAGIAPRAPHWGRSAPPDPLQLMLAA